MQHTSRPQLLAVILSVGTGAVVILSESFSSGFISPRVRLAAITIAIPALWVLIPAILQSAVAFYRRNTEKTGHQDTDNAEASTQTQSGPDPVRGSRPETSTTAAPASSEDETARSEPDNDTIEGQQADGQGFSMGTVSNIGEEKVFTGEETVADLSDIIAAAQEHCTAGDNDTAATELSRAADLLHEIATGDGRQETGSTLREIVLLKLRTAQEAVEESADAEPALADAVAAGELFEAHRQAREAITTARQAREGERLDQLLRSLTVLEEARRQLDQIDTAECPIEDATERVNGLQTTLREETELIETARQWAER